MCFVLIECWLLLALPVGYFVEFVIVVAIVNIAISPFLVNSIESNDVAAVSKFVNYPILHSVACGIFLPFVIQKTDATYFAILNSG